MDCPYCGHKKTYVYGSRPGLIQKRYRECEACEQTFITKETPITDLYMYKYLEYLEGIGEIDKQEFKNATKHNGNF